MGVLVTMVIAAGIFVWRQYHPPPPDERLLRGLAWAMVHDVLPPGWVVDRPVHDAAQGTWEVRAYDPVKTRKGALTTTGTTESEALRSMARLLDRRLE